MYASVRAASPAAILSSNQQPPAESEDRSRPPSSLSPARVSCLIDHATRVTGSDGVLPSPLSRCCLVPRAVGFVDVGDLWYQRVVRVRVCEHGADGEEDCGAPCQYRAGERLVAGCSVPFEMVSAGLHWSRRMSRQMLPLLLMFG